MLENFMRSQSSIVEIVEQFGKYAVEDFQPYFVNFADYRVFYAATLLLPNIQFKKLLKSRKYTKGFKASLSNFVIGMFPDNIYDSKSINAEIQKNLQLLNNY
jgi:hypothetical protein